MSVMLLSPLEIKGLRKMLRLTAAELAAKIGVKWNTVAQWEMGRRRPSGAALVLLHQLKSSLEKMSA